MRFESTESTCIDLPLDDIDTDQIIPARYLKVLDRDGLRDGLFHALRYPDGVNPDPACALNDPARRGASIVLAGHNFGCGSSREHAVWALLGWGIRAVVAPSFGDIFRANALKNGLLPVAVPGSFVELLRQHSAGGGLVRADLDAQTVGIPGGPQHAFAIDPFARRCILAGVDEFGYLLSRLPQIQAYEESRP